MNIGLYGSFHPIRYNHVNVISVVHCVWCHWLEFLNEFLNRTKHHRNRGNIMFCYFDLGLQCSLMQLFTIYPVKKIRIRLVLIFRLYC